VRLSAVPLQSYHVAPDPAGEGARLDVRGSPDSGLLGWSYVPREFERSGRLHLALPEFKRSLLAFVVFATEPDGISLHSEDQPPGAWFPPIFGGAQLRWPSQRRWGAWCAVVSRKRNIWWMPARCALGGVESLVRKRSALMGIHLYSRHFLNGP
jgi:hypothetical protein